MKNKLNASTFQTRAPMLGKYIAFSVTLFILILIFSSAGFLLSMREIIRDNKGRELTKLLELEKIKLENYVNKEIAIVLKMASSPLIRRHFENPQDTTLKQLAIDEIDSYRNVLMGKVFRINDIDKLFYFDDQEPYWLDMELPENYWYKMTLYDTKNYNFNINYNPDLNVTNLWINAPVFSNKQKPVGMLGIGIDLTAFIRDLYDVYKSDGRNVSFYFFNDAEEITGAKEIALVANKTNVREVLGHFGAQTVETAKNLANGESYTFAAASGQAAVISIPLLEWYAVAFLPDNLDDYDTPLTTFFILGITIIAFILILSNIVIARLLKPLRETMSSLIAASKAKSDFLAKMSHEIRTPMNAILGVSQVQLEKENLPDEFKGAFDIIHNSSTTLLGIINDILDLSKIETGKLVLHPVEYDLPSLICDVVQLNITRIGSKPVDFKLKINENLPTKLVGDDLRLKQILNNILSNSFKYTDKGSVKLSITHADLTADDVTLVFVIEDTGQGIKEEDRKQLFSEYMRLNTDINRNVEGTGLGLNIAKRLVTMMDGTISVESEYKKGSTFTVTVKQQLAQNSGVIGAEHCKNLQSFAFASITRSAGKQIKRNPLPNGSVLVVDDVETNLLIAEMMLAPYKLKIDKAASGKSAIEKIDAGNVYDIVFMDHMMPDMDGIETTKILRAKGYPKTIIALTANAIVGNREMFMASGFDDFISKPIDIAELDKVLNAYIRTAQPVNHSQEKKYMDGNNASKPRTPTIVKMNERLMAALRKDVEKSIVAIRESLANDDIKLFTATVHGLKSAFAAIGENDISQLALELELAGRNNDTETISAKVDTFLTKLGNVTGA